MFEADMKQSPQTVVGWNLRPDILIHGSPCQDFSIAGHQGKAKAEAGRINRGKGADEGSKTRSRSTCEVQAGKMNRTLYHQAGNSIVVPIFEEMFRVIFESGIIERTGDNEESKV